MKPHRPFWDHATDAEARKMAGRAVEWLRSRRRGPFRPNEVRELIQDILGLSEPAGIPKLSRLQCKRLVAWLIYLRLA